MRAIKEIGRRIKEGKDSRGWEIEKIIIPYVFLLSIFTYFANHISYLHSNGVHSSMLDRRDHVTGHLLTSSGKRIGTLHIPFNNWKMVM